MKNPHRVDSLVISLALLTAAGCGSSSGTSAKGTGGVQGSGGLRGTGGTGATATGGVIGSGGAEAGSGGQAGSGVGAGGSTGTGGGAGEGLAGAPGSGGTAGGLPAGGGRAGTGGAGGALAAGGAGAPGASGGTPGAGGGSAGGATSSTMTFFATSRGPDNGGNLNGLAGADAFCTMLAAAVSAELGAKTWHAYLSTSTVSARDRIGAGPWRNAAGQIIANNLTDLHDQIAANAALNATWPVGSTTVALDERGNPVPTSPNVHDILTGSNTDGTVATGFTCNDWTSQSTMDMVQVGHTNRTGGGRPPSWNSAHASGCGAFTANAQAGTVSQGGGRGSLYCFAVP